MFGGSDNSNPVLPVFMEENGSQYDATALPQLQLFGDFPVGCSADPLNYMAIATNRPIKRARKPEPNSKQQKLQISLNNNFCQDEAGHASRILNQNPVSTGLKLSYEEDERNSSITSASEGMKAALPGSFSLSNSLKIEIDRQEKEFDHYIRLQSIDVLTPESSLIYGEAPTIIVPNHNENAILTIFQNSGKDFAGFGAEQVVLVRDDSSRREISDYIGKKALGLTIMECKGLEFQDVLLYNFFSSSPMRNHWEVIYEYMEKKDLQISTSPQHFQGFNLEKHTALCSELKQLYVPITRTRQRLWICEDEGFCDSIFNYWTKLNLVKVRKLDYESVKEMQIVSSQEEWKSRGIKSLGAEKDGLDIIQHEWALPKFEQRAEATLRKLIS